MTDSSATQSEILAQTSNDPTLLYFLFWLPSFAYLLSIMYFFSHMSKITGIVAILFGLLSFSWHLSCLIFTFTRPLPSSLEAIIYYNTLAVVLWYVELLFNLILLISQVIVTFTNNWTPINDEFIDTIECFE